MRQRIYLGLAANPIVDYTVIQLSSGCGAARQRACMGCKRSRVQIPAPRQEKRRSVRCGVMILHVKESRLATIAVL